MANVKRGDFIKAVYAAHQNGTGHAGVAAALQMKLGSVSTRISQLRSQGFEMPTFGRGGGGASNPDEDLALVAELTGKPIEEVRAEYEVKQKALKEAKAAKEAEAKRAAENANS